MSHSALTALSSEYNCIESEHHRGADLQQREGVPGQQHWDRPVISTLMRFNGKTGKMADHRESACAPHLMAKVMWHFPSNWIHSSESNWPWREVTYLQAGVVTCVCVCVCVCVWVRGLRKSLRHWEWGCFCFISHFQSLFDSQYLVLLLQDRVRVRPYDIFHTPLFSFNPMKGPKQHCIDPANRYSRRSQSSIYLISLRLRAPLLSRKLIKADQWATLLHCV